MAIALDDVPRLWRLARLDYDPARQRLVDPRTLDAIGAVLHAAQRATSASDSA